MIILKPDFYDAFRCIADKCTLSCCTPKWDIEIDEETYQKYQGMEGELGDKIRSNLTSKLVNGNEFKHVMKLCENGCPMLNEKGLCEIIIQKGEEYLSKTCTLFPRESGSNEKLMIKIFSLSCPAVVEFLYKKQIGISITPTESQEEIYSAEELNSLAFSTFKITMELLRIEQFPLSTKQFIVLDLLSKVKKLYQEDNFEGIEEVFTQFTNSDYLINSANEVQKNNMDPEFKLNNLYRIFDVIQKKISFINFSRKISITFKEFDEKEKIFNEQVFRKIEYVFENICVYEIFRQFMRVDIDELYEKCSVIFIEAAMIKFIFFVDWVSDGKLFSKEEQKMMIAAVSRLFTNNRNFVNNFYNANKELDIFMNPIDMYMLIK